TLKSSDEFSASVWLGCKSHRVATTRQNERDVALVHVEHTGERYYEAEIHRLKGALLLQQSLDNQAEAETCFHQSLDIARNQQAKSWELRAATSLARLWQQQGRRDEARQVLGDVYNWFTEGFDTADLKDAKALLNELGA